MNALGHLIGRMIGAGMSPEEAGAIAAEIYAAGVASASVRSSGAERTRRWRNNKASQSVTERHGVTLNDGDVEASQSVTERHKASQCDATTVSPIDTKIKNYSMRNSAKASRGSRLSPEWIPSDQDRLAARSEGLSEAEIDKEALRFRDYWIGRAGSGGSSSIGRQRGETGYGRRLKSWGRRHLPSRALHLKSYSLPHLEAKNLMPGKTTVGLSLERLFLGTRREGGASRLAGHRDISHKLGGAGHDRNPLVAPSDFCRTQGGVDHGWQEGKSQWQNQRSVSHIFLRAPRAVSSLASAWLMIR